MRPTSWHSCGTQVKRQCCRKCSQTTFRASDAQRCAIRSWEVTLQGGNWQRSQILIPATSMRWPPLLQTKGELHNEDKHCRDLSKPTSNKYTGGLSFARPSVYQCIKCASSATSRNAISKAPWKSLMVCQSRATQQRPAGRSGDGQKQQK